MQRKILLHLLQLARTSGALQSSADIKDTSIMPEALKVQCIASRDRLDAEIERIMAEQELE